MVNGSKYRLNKQLLSILKIIFFTYCLFSFKKVSALNYAPWNEDVLKLKADLQGGYQNYRFLKLSHHRYKYPGQDGFAKISFSLAPDTEKDLQIETFISRTHAHHLAINSLKQMGRYFFLDDARGDPYSLSAGISLHEIFTIGLKDPSFFNHAHIEIEGHIAFGKEWAKKELWEQRVFLVTYLGFGLKESYWGKVSAVYEKCFNRRNFLKLTSLFSVGFGKKSLIPLHFQGFRLVKYRAFDLKLEYSYLTDDEQKISFEILQRLYSKQAPYLITQCILKWNFPIKF